MSTMLPNRIYMQLKFYPFKTEESRSVDANVDEYLKIVVELNSLNVIISKEV